jgi:SNF2 family DNA or RNA helicase
VIRIIEAGRILLADEMGLGKTIQAIAAIEIFARFLNVKKVLIICPTSLKYQWKREIEKFTTRDATIVEGMVHKRRELYACDSFIKIISYGLCRNDGDLIGKWSPDMVIIDEAQRIKNWKTQTAKAVKKIDTEYALVLTGTPLENRIDELHSIVEFVDRYRLGPLFRFLNNHQMLDEHGKLAGYRNLRTINKTLEGILLRRTKKEIADQLPGRTDKNFFVELTKEQVSWHNEYYEIVCRLVNKMDKDRFPFGGRETETSD